MKADWEWWNWLMGRGNTVSDLRRNGKEGRGVVKGQVVVWLIVRTWLTWMFVVLLTQWLLDSKTPEDKKTWDRHTVPLRMLCTNDKWRGGETRRETAFATRDASELWMHAVSWRTKGRRAKEGGLYSSHTATQPHEISINWNTIQMIQISSN